MSFKVEVRKTGKRCAAGCADLPGFVSEGDTEDEVLQDIQAVLKEQFKSKDGKPENTKVHSIDVSDFPYEEPQDLQQRRKEHGFLVVRPFSMNFPPEWTSGKVEDLFDLLNKPANH